MLDFQKYVLYYYQYFCRYRRSLSISTKSSFLSVSDLPYCFIARYNPLPALHEPPNNIAVILFASFVPNLSRNISRNHIRFSITFSYSPRLPDVPFFQSPPRSESGTFPTLFRLFIFTLWTRLTVATLFPSSRSILRNIHAPLHPLRFASSCTVANVRSCST